MSCRNLECRNGLAPGVIPVGKGPKSAPLIQAGSKTPTITMRWAWVRCLACNANEDDRKAGIPYKHVQRSTEEIARRAELATNKAPYAIEKPKKGSVLDAFAQIRANTLPPVNSVPQDNDRLNKLLEQVSQLNTTIMKLTNQVGDLLEENRTLRKQLEGRTTSVSSATEVTQ